MSKQRIFSGVQPSGTLHLGNYLGAIKNWVKLQDSYESIFCVVDLHAITVPQDPEELKKKTIEVARIYLAAGIDPEKCSIFIQSHVQEHTELCWILNTIAKNGELARMTQFKDKAFIDFDEFENTLSELMDNKYKAVSDKSKELIKKLSSEKAAEISKSASFETVHHFFSVFKDKFNKVGVGLFDYPVLMAADILLYNTDLVPVGKDQKQHIELTRDLAVRFNKRFGETFIIPKPYTTEVSENIMALDDPTKKMSKSAASEYNYIALTDDAETVKWKIKKAVTDSGAEIKYEDGKPALKNLINIYSLLSDQKPQEIEKMYAGKGPARNATHSVAGGYAGFKTDLAEVIIKFLTPFQERMAELSDEKVLEILRAGAAKVRPLAQEKMQEVKKKIGLIL